MTEVLAKPLPVGPYDRRGNSWWGVMCLIATEGSLFAYLLFSYYYFDVQLPHSWRPAEPPKLDLSAPDTAILILSSVAVWFGERSLKKDRRGLAALGIAIGLLLGCVFVGVQLLEWKAKPFTMSSSAYGSLYFTVTGFHMAHVAAGVIILLALFAWSLFGYFDERRHVQVSIGAIYWHFVDVVWIAIFFTFYVTPYLG